MSRLVALAAALGVISTSAVAQDNCWTAKELTAARVRDLQSVLMVGALQCRTSGHDVLSEFNKFVIAGRTTIVSQNDVLKARFIRLMGKKEGERAYDSFTTALANDHAGSTSQAAGFCTMAQALAVEASAAAAQSQAIDTLESIAERLGERPQGVGMSCTDVKAAPVVTASAKKDAPRTPGASPTAAAAMAATSSASLPTTPGSR